jgi:hypothetical protein
MGHLQIHASCAGVCRATLEVSAEQPEPGNVVLWQGNKFMTIDRPRASASSLGWES